MAESAASLVDDILPDVPIRQWLVTFPHALRFLFATRPAVMGRVLGIVYRTLATHQLHKARYTRRIASTGAVTLIQRFGSALNLNLHFHMLEPRRLYRRLQILRGLEHEQIKTVFPGDTGTGGSDAIRT